jgi:hypothetical protein
MLLHVSTLVVMLTPSNYYKNAKELQLKCFVSFHRDLLFLLHSISHVFYSSFLPYLPSNFISSFFQPFFHFLSPSFLLVYWFLLPLFILLHLSTFVHSFIFPFFRCASSFLWFLLNISLVPLTDFSRPWLYRKLNLSPVTRLQCTNVRTCLPTFPEVEHNSAAGYNSFFSVPDIKIINTNLLTLTVCS